MTTDSVSPMELSVLQEMDLSDQEIARRKEFLEFREEDAQLLRGLNDLALKYADSVIDDFYKHFMSFEETRAFFQDPATLTRVKQLQKDYFLRLTNGTYGADYVANRLKCRPGPPAHQAGRQMVSRRL